MKRTSAEMRTYEVGLVLVVHAQNIEEVQRTLQSCLPSDLRVEAKTLQYCEETLGRYTVN